MKVKFKPGNIVKLTSDNAGWVFEQGAIFKIIRINSSNYEVKALKVKEKRGFPSSRIPFDFESMFSSIDDDCTLLPRSKLLLSYYNI